MGKVFERIGNIFRKREASSQGTIYQTAIQFFREEELTFQEDKEQSLISLGVAGENGKWLAIALIDEQEEYLTLYSICPVTEALINEYYPILIASTESTIIEPLTISDIQLAYECPRLFYLGCRQGGEKKFIRDRNLEEEKNIFNELLSPSIQLFKTDSHFQQLFEPAAETLQINTIAQQIQNLLYQTTFFPYLQNKIKRDPQKALTLQQTWQTITQLIKRWTEILILNRRYYSSQEIFSRTFIAQQQNWQHSFNLANNQQQLTPPTTQLKLCDRCPQKQKCQALFKTI